MGHIVTDHRNPCPSQLDFELDHESDDRTAPRFVVMAPPCPLSESPDIFVARGDVAGEDV